MPTILSFAGIRGAWRKELSLRAGGWAAAVCLMAMGGVGWAKGPAPPVTIPLEQLGQQPLGGRPQVPGSTVATVDFVGDHHLLVTFPVRRLMKRLPESQPEDEDRMIDAVLVDIPSGKVAARSTWRVHDGGVYLWNLGRGRFLLRERDRLFTVAPLANLSTEHPFQEHRLLSFERKVLGVLVSAENDLLTVETVERPAPKPVEEAAAARPMNASGLLTRPQAAAASGSVSASGTGTASGSGTALGGGTASIAGTSEAAKRHDAPVEINFYRIGGEGEAVQAVSAGRILSPLAVDIPMTAEGYLDTSEESRGRWLFDYIAHGGKKTELSPFDTTCFPRAKFVSRSEFVAFGCHGSIDRVEIGGFNMRGEQMWQQQFFENFVHPTFSLAPEGGRFALGRAITTSAPSMLAGVEPDGMQLTGQDVQVLQTHSGKQVFHVVLTPAQRAGQNFSLAPDGLRLAVIQSGAVQVYQLPPLSPKDEREVRGAREIALEHHEGPIVLPSRSRVTVAATRPRSDAGADPEAATGGKDPAFGGGGGNVGSTSGAAEAVPDSASSQGSPGEAKKPAGGEGKAVDSGPAKPRENPLNVGDVPQSEGDRKAPSLLNPGEAPPH